MVPLDPPEEKEREKKKKKDGIEAFNIATLIPTVGILLEKKSYLWSFVITYRKWKKEKWKMEKNPRTPNS